MGLFRKSKKPTPTSTDPITTYHINQNLSGKLTVTPTPPNYLSYSITISMKKAWRDTIEVAIHRNIDSTFQNSGDVVGHCLIQTMQGKFLKTRFDSYGEDIKLEKHGSNLRDVSKTYYNLDIPNLGSYTWSHDTSGFAPSSQRLKLSDQTGSVLARFGGSQSGVSEFGVLEVYSPQMANDRDWCGLVILTAVCVFAREERRREKKEKTNNVVGTIGNWGGLLTMGVPVGN